MNKKKPFDREKAKFDLENYLIDKIKDSYMNENKKAKLKNDEGKKSDKDQQQIDHFLIQLNEINPALGTIIQEVQNCRKLNNELKQDYIVHLMILKTAFEKFIKEKLMPVKPTEWIFTIIEKTKEILHSLHKNISILNNAGCCGIGKPKHILNQNFLRLNEVTCFWDGLVNLTAREGYQERHIVPDFNEKEIRKELKKILEENIPHEQEPILKEVIKRVETGTKPDNIKEAHELLFGFGRPQHVLNAIKIYQTEADTHDSNINACLALGRIYLDGQFIQKDLKKAYFYFQRAREKGDPSGESEYQIGRMIEFGYIQDEGLDSSEIRIDAAIEFYESAAEKENLDAITDLGYIYYKREEHQKGILYYKKAKKKKFPRALNNLGKIYMDGNEKEKMKDDNSRKAVKYFELAANYGHVKAIYNLGVCYEKGIGVQINYEKAYSLFKESARKGDNEAKLFYCSHLLKNALGTNNDEDFLEAMQMLREVVSADQENKEAFFYIGYLYENGFGVNKDYKVALNYYNKAANLRHGPSLNKLGDFFFSGCGVEKADHLMALHYYEKAIEEKDIDAIINLGTLYENTSNQIQKDFKKAWSYYEKASELGDSRGFLNMGHMKEEGTYKGDNEKGALYYYEEAAKLGNNNAIELLAAKGKTYISSNNIMNEKLRESNMESFFNYNPNMKGGSVYKNKLMESDKKNKKNNNLVRDPMISGYLGYLPSDSKKENNNHQPERKNIEINSDRYQTEKSYENEQDSLISDKKGKNNMKISSPPGKTSTFSKKK